MTSHPKKEFASIIKRLAPGTNKISKEDEKKYHERIYFDSFVKQHFKDNVDEVKVGKDGVEPDFLLKYHNKSYGVELTEIYTHIQSDQKFKNYSETELKDELYYAINSKSKKWQKYGNKYNGILLIHTNELSVEYSKFKNFLEKINLCDNSFEDIFFMWNYHPVQILDSDESFSEGYPYLKLNNQHR